MILSATVNKDRIKGDDSEKVQCVIGDFATPSEEILMSHEMEGQVCLQDDDGDLVCFVPGEGPESLEQRLHLDDLEGPVVSETVKTPEVVEAVKTKME